jgi:hypothetical protein
MRRQWLLKGLLLLILVVGIDVAWKLEANAEERPRLAILPFLAAQTEEPGRGALCPICKGVYGKGDIAPGVQRTLTRLLNQKMEAVGTFSVLPSVQVEEAFSLLDKRALEERPLATFIQLGKRLESDYIFIGFVFRFEERVGSSIGVEKPASVGYDLHLIRLRDGRTVWTGKFNETQRPLSENILNLGSFLRRKASWLTAEELASVGMDEALMKLPRIKELEE